MKNLSNENVIHVNNNGIQYIQFKKLLEYRDIVNHAYGIGLDRNYRTSKNKGEEAYNKAVKDYKDLCTKIEINYMHCIKPCQEHTKNVRIVKQKMNVGKLDFEQDEYKSTDGLITNQPNIALATTNADCILFMFFDPEKKVIANVHSGWRGTLQRISIQAVNKMQNEYGCDTKNIICCICPSIRKCHFEVQSDVQKLYYEEFKTLKGIDDLIIPDSKQGKWHIDTVEINKIILKQAGLKEKNIIDSGICSVCNSDLIHSYRVEKKGYGLGTAIIELK